MRLCLFEDRPETFEPLTTTRGVFDLVCGIDTLADKWRKRFPNTPIGLMVRPHLEEMTQLRHPGTAVNDWTWLRSDDVILVNARWLPPAMPTFPADPCVGLLEGEVAFAVPGSTGAWRITADTLDDFLENQCRNYPTTTVTGTFLRFPWDLVALNGFEIERDLDRRFPTKHEAPVALVGPAANLRIAPSARIDPYVVADTTLGPVVVDERAVITAFTRLEGPCYIGPGTHLLGAKIRAGTTLGPQSRIGGEVEASIVLGYSNKYHEGFLGHAYLGEWVNLGAGTHNSDLRNDYGEVSVVLGGQRMGTGHTKVGCFLGDHVKTGLGTLLNTGTNVGAFSNLLPAGRLAPKYVPPFTSWWNGQLREDLDFNEKMATARIVMQRRGQALSEIHERVYRTVFNETRMDTVQRPPLAA